MYFSQGPNKGLANLFPPPFISVQSPHVCVTHQHRDRGSLGMVQWVVQSGSLEATDRHKVNNTHSSPSRSITRLAECSAVLTCCGWWWSCGCCGWWWSCGWW